MTKSCENQVTYYVDRGFSCIETQVKCGNTDPYGERALCDDCFNDWVKRVEHEAILENAEHDNACLKAAGWGEA